MLDRPPHPGEEPSGVDVELDEDGDPTCAVYVGGTQFREYGVPIPFWHLFVLHRDKNEEWTLFAGEPDWTAPVQCKDRVINNGFISAHSKGVFSWKSSEAGYVRIAKGQAACKAYDCFLREIARITTDEVCYERFGPNSNSVAYTVLTRCELEAAKPDVLAYGWGMLV